MKVVSLKCANCGAGLEIGPDIEQFACSYCGAQQVVERSGGIVSLRKIATTLNEVKQATDRTASELALKRLQAEAASIEARRDAEISALRAADEKSNGRIGLVLVVGAILSAVLVEKVGWWSLSIVLIGAIIGWKSISTVSDKIVSVRRRAESQLAPLYQQIAHHQATVDSYDFRRPST